MADQEKEKKPESESTQKVKAYDKLIKKLQKEREQLLDEVNRDYKEARRYVRSHPEEGVLIGFISGIALGVLLGKLLK